MVIDDCKCRNGYSGVDFDSPRCELILEGAYCKTRASSYCRKSVAKLALAYQRASNAKDPKCFRDDPTYRGSQKASIQCTGKTAQKIKNCSF